VSLGLTNLTSGRLPLTITPEGCATASPESLPTATSTTVTVTVPERCDTTFTLSADGTSVDVTPEPAGAELTQWSFLFVFVVALAVFLVIAWRWQRRLEKAGKTELFVESSWSFKESWAGNVTVLGGLLTGVLGTSEVVKALLGSDADSAIALATVGSAIAVALIGAGPVILSATKVRTSDRYSVRGMLTAAAVTIAGGIGELVVVTITAWRLDLGIVWQVLVGIAGAVGVALLCVYFVRSVRAMADHHTTAPDAGDRLMIMGGDIRVATTGVRRSASL
jgi:hypothetical protein